MDDPRALAAEIEALDGQATPGPWESGPNPEGWFSNEVVVRPKGEFPHGLWVADFGCKDDREHGANAALIVALRNHAPAIARCLRRLADAEEALRDARAGMEKHDNADFACESVEGAQGAGEARDAIEAYFARHAGEGDGDL